MSFDCHHHIGLEPLPYRRVLWVALVVNAAMFFLELGIGLQVNSQALLADAIDFFSDASNYALSLMVLTSGGCARARAAQVKGWCMLSFGVLVIGKTLWSLAHGTPPQALAMGLVASLALLANVGVTILLYAYRHGDANQRSVWLCSRNDAIGNVAVMLAALGVAGTHSVWPDLLVAAIMAALAISSGWAVLSQARRELTSQV